MASGYNVKLNLNINVVGGGNAQREIASVTNQLGNLQSRASTLLMTPGISPVAANVIRSSLVGMGMANLAVDNAQRGIRSEVTKFRSFNDISEINLPGAMPTITSMRRLGGFGEAVHEYRTRMLSEGNRVTKREAERYVTQAIIARDTTALSPGLYNRLQSQVDVSHQAVRNALGEDSDRAATYDDQWNRTRGAYNTLNSSIMDRGKAGSQLDKTVKELERESLKTLKAASALGQEVNDDLVTMISQMKSIQVDMKKTQAQMRMEKKKHGSVSESTLNLARGQMQAYGALADTARASALSRGLGTDSTVMSVLGTHRTGEIMNAHHQATVNATGYSDQFVRQQYRFDRSAAPAYFGEVAGRHLFRKARNESRMDRYASAYVEAQQRGDVDMMEVLDRKMGRVNTALRLGADRVRAAGIDSFDPVAREIMASEFDSSRTSHRQSLAEQAAARRRGQISQTREAQRRQVHAMDVIHAENARGGYNLHAMVTGYGALSSDLNRMTPSELSAFEGRLLQVRQAAHHLASNRNLPGMETRTRVWLDQLRSRIGENTNFDIESIDDVLGMTDTALARVRGARGSVYRPDSILGVLGYSMTGGEGGGRGAYGRRNNTLFNKFNQNITSFSGMAGLSLYGLGSIGLATALSRVTIQGAGEAEGMKNILAGLVNANYRYVDTAGNQLSPEKSFALSSYRSQGMYKDVREAAVKSVLTTQEMFDYVLSGSPTLMRRGLSFEESMPIIDAIASVGKSMGYQAPAIMSDIRDLAMGTVTTRSQVLRTLGIDSESLRAAMSKGPDGLREYFETKISPFKGALDRIQDTPLGKISRFQDLTQQIGIQAGQGMLSGGFLDSLERIYERLQKMEADGTFERAGTAMGKFVEGLTNAALTITSNPIFQNFASNPVMAMGTAFGTYMAGSAYVNAVRGRIASPFDAQEAASMPGRFARTPGMGEFSFLGTIFADQWGGALPGVDGVRRPTPWQARKGQLATWLSQPARGQAGLENPITRAESIGNRFKKGVGAVALAAVGLEAFGEMIAGSRGTAAYEDMLESTNPLAPQGFDALVSGLKNPNLVSDYTKVTRQLMATEAGTAFGDQTLSTEDRMVNRGISTTREPILLAAMASMLRQGDKVGSLSSTPRVENVSVEDLGIAKKMLSENVELQRFFEQEIRTNNYFQETNARGEIVNRRGGEAFRYLQSRYGGGTFDTIEFTGDKLYYGAKGLTSTRQDLERQRAVMERLNGGRIMSEAQLNEERRNLARAQQAGTVDQFLINKYLSQNPSVRSDIDQSRMLFGQAASAQTGAYAVLDAQLSRQMGFVAPRNQGNIAAQQRAIGMAGLQNQFLVGMSQEGANPTALVQQFLAQQEQLEGAYEQSLRAIVSERMAREEHVRSIKEQTQLTRLQTEGDRATFFANIMPGSSMADIEARYSARLNAISITGANREQAISIQTRAAGRTDNVADQIAGMSVSQLERAAGVTNKGLQDTEIGGLKVEFAQMNAAFGLEFAKASSQIKEASLSFKEAFDQQKQTQADLVNRTLEYINATNGLGVKVGTLEEAVRALTDVIAGRVSAPAASRGSTPQNVPATAGDALKSALGLPSRTATPGTASSGSNNMYSAPAGPPASVVLNPLLANALGVSGSSNAPKAVMGANQQVTNAGQSEGWINPVSGRRTSSYGMRFHPIYKENRMHHGVDVAAKTGTPVGATRSGKVVFAGTKRGYGNTVEIDHGNGYVSRYAHLSSIDVEVGDTVSSNQRVGGVGSTGGSTGPHLHFEILKNGRSVDPDKIVSNIGGKGSNPSGAPRSSGKSGVTGQVSADYEGLRQAQLEAARLQNVQEFYSATSMYTSERDRTRAIAFSRQDAFNQLNNSVLLAGTDPFSINLARDMASLQSDRLRSQYAYEDAVAALQKQYDTEVAKVAEQIRSRQISVEQGGQIVVGLEAVRNDELVRLQNAQLQADNDLASGTYRAQQRMAMAQQALSVRTGRASNLYGLQMQGVGLTGRDLARFNETFAIRETMAEYERIIGATQNQPGWGELFARQYRAGNLQLAERLAAMNAGFQFSDMQEGINNTLAMERMDRRQQGVQRRVTEAQRRFTVGVTGTREGLGEQMQRMFSEELDMTTLNVPTMASLQADFIAQNSKMKPAELMAALQDPAQIAKFEQAIKDGMIAALETQERKMNNPARMREIRAAMMQDRIIGSGTDFGTNLMMNPMALFMGGQRSDMISSMVGPYAQQMFGEQVSKTALGFALSQGRTLSGDQLRSLGLRRNPKNKGQYINEQGQVVDLGRMNRTQLGELAAQYGGNLIGNFLGQQVFGGDPASTNLGTQIGALAGPSLFAGLGSFGGPVGAVVGGMLGGIFGRRRNPEDEELRRWRDGVLRGISNMDKSLRFQNDIFRSIRGEQLTGVASRFLGNRYNSTSSREASLGIA